MDITVNTRLKENVYSSVNTKEYRRQAILRWKDKRIQKKKAYKKQAILRWKNKKLKSKRASESIKTSLSDLGETSNSKRRQRTRPIGRDLLELLPFTADILPRVGDCSYCQATKFYSETSNFCCLDGRVVLVNNQLPSIMTELLTSMSDEAKMFRTYIRTYNNLFAFTSLGVKSDCTYSKRNKGIYTFRVQGQVYHFINDLLPQNNGAKNLQLYFHDTGNELQNRFMACPRLSEQLIEKCIQYLQQNPYAYFFRNLKDIPNLDDCKIILKTISTQDQRVYNKPEVSQVAAIWVEGEDNGEQGRRNIEVKTHSDQSKSIEYYYGCYDPLQYPLMFPFGETGWHQGIPKKKELGHNKKRQHPSTTDNFISPANIVNVEDLLNMEESVLGKKCDNSKFVSVREYYAYKLQIRSSDKSYLLYFGRLLQQYIVDNYIKLETQRLDFYRLQQQEIRQEFLQGVVDAMANGETEGSAIGRRIVLPATFIGGPRNMRRKYVDAMTLVQKFGKPDIFLTMTCNPNWPEIKEHLLCYEETQNRPDLVG